MLDEQLKLRLVQAKFHFFYIKHKINKGIQKYKKTNKKDKSTYQNY